MFTIPKGGTNHSAGERSESFILRKEKDVTGGIIESTGQETERHLVAVFSKFVLGPKKAMVASITHFEDAGGRLPATLLGHGKDDRSIGGHSRTIAST